MSAFQSVKVSLRCSRNVRFVCSPSPYSDARSAGSAVVSSRYLSLNTSAVEVSKRTSPLERRKTVKRNGEACRVKVRSDVAAERTRLCGEGEASVLDWSYWSRRKEREGMSG